jgi:acyl carrier protein
MNGAERVVSWIMERNPDLTEPPSVDDDLIESHLISSLDFVDFLYFLEELTGIEIDMATVEVDDFRSVAAICRRYLAGANHR